MQLRPGVAQGTQTGPCPIRITPPTRDQGVGTTPIEIAEELEGHREYKRAKTYAPKSRVYVAGVKRKQLINQVPTDEDSNPLFITEPIEQDVGGRCGCPKWNCTTCLPCCGLELSSDADLVYHLKMEAMFTPRTPLLLQQLKMKAKRWLASWDMSKYSSEQVFKMMLHGVTMAYTISDAERDVMRALKDSEVVKLADKFNSLFGQRG